MRGAESEWNLVFNFKHGGTSLIRTNYKSRCKLPNSAN